MLPKMLPEILPKMLPKRTTILFLLTALIVGLSFTGCVKRVEQLPASPASSISTPSNVPTSSLKDKLKHAQTIMWISAHPDDELYTGGTFGYFTRDLHGHLVIVSLYYNPKFVDNNRQSAEFLGDADYIRIQERIYKEEGRKITARCYNWDQLDDVVNELEKAGVKDYVKKIILEYKPDIVFGFESTNGFRHSCQHVSFAKIVDEAVKELRAEGYNFFDYYYVLNRDPNWFGEEKMDPLPFTDAINLSNEMWNYKLKLFDIYSEHYPKLESEKFRASLKHEEWFRKVSGKTNQSSQVAVKRETLYYGSSKEQYVDVYYINSDKTAIFVHGGAFLIGSARGSNFNAIKPYFLDRGYNVVSVEYRKCTETNFENVLSDIYNGINFAIDKVSKLREQNQIVYIGMSAGSTAASILLAGKSEFKIDDEVKYFILLSGVYNPAQQRELRKGTICESIVNYLNFSKKVSPDVHVFLVEGMHDKFDLYPQTDESNLEYFKNVLLSKGVKDVRTLWIEGGHGDTKIVFEDPEYQKLIDDFLQIGRNPTPPTSTPTCNDDVLFFDFHYGLQKKNPALFSDHPLVDTVILLVPWPIVEPQRGKFDFSELDNAINTWHAKGKNVVLRFIPYGQVGGNVATPSWVYDYVPAIVFSSHKENRGTVRIPKVWDDSFLEIYSEFIGKVADHYNSDERVKYVEIGIGHLGYTTAQPSKEGKDAFLQAGWNIDVWKSYVEKVVDLYDSKFSNKKLILTFSPLLLRGYYLKDHPDFGKDVEYYAARKGYSFLFKGISENYEEIENTGFLPLIDYLTEIKPEAGISSGFGDDWPLIGRTGGGYRTKEDFKKILDNILYIKENIIKDRYPVFLVVLDNELKVTYRNSPEFDGEVYSWLKSFLGNLSPSCSGSVSFTNSSSFVPKCQTLWWYDNEHRFCQQKRFCGQYMYPGLHTFKTKEECEASLISASS